MKILITGGSGFIGSHCAEALINQGDEVTVFDTQPPIHEFNSKYVAGDLLDRIAIQTAVKGNDLVIHAGSILGTHETVIASHETARTNILGGLNVLDAVQKYGNSIIIISKPNVWLNPYSITKDSMEKFGFMYVNEFDVKLAIVKLFNVYGPRQKYSHVQKAMPFWIVNALRSKPLDIFGRGTSTVDLVYARDVSDAIRGIVNNFEKCRIRKVSKAASDIWSNFPEYNQQILELGSGSEITVIDAVEELKKELGTRLEIRHLPMRRGEIDGTRLCANITRLSKMTGYKPKTSLRDGLKETIAYYRKHMSLIDQGKL